MNTNDFFPVPDLWKVYDITQVSPQSDFNPKWLRFLTRTMTHFNLPKAVVVTSPTDPVLKTIKFHEGRVFYTDFVIVKKTINTHLEGSVVWREDFITLNAPPPEATSEQIDEYWNKISSYYGDNVLMVEVYDHSNGDHDTFIGYAFVPSRWLMERIYDQNEQFTAAFLYNSSGSVEEAVSNMNW